MGAPSITNYKLQIYKSINADISNKNNILKNVSKNIFTKAEYLPEIVTVSSLIYNVHPSPIYYNNKYNASIIFIFLRWLIMRILKINKILFHYGKRYGYRTNLNFLSYCREFHFFSGSNLLICFFYNETSQRNILTVPYKF